jgi:hypothetical protein
MEDENIVVLAFKKSPSLDFSDLYERAAAIKNSSTCPPRTGSTA